MDDRVILLPLALIEGVHLARLVDEFRMLLDEEAPEDAGLARLTPDAYPEDRDAAATYSELTRRELLDRRAGDARVVRAALDGFRIEDDDDDDAVLAPRDVVIRVDDLDAWLRTLTAMRLVMASRLGVDESDEHHPDDPRFAVYDWLGYRLDGLIRVADEQDAPPERP
ncbi:MULTISPECIES: DUF2017 domain-containing protein [Microbacterium]|uniref:DUF2017 domain-containing protein n=1 Tax=Microbacterium TaxID=33882 RepID=UPI00217DA33A|nr:MULTISPECIES: DUF2017 domain-containing protein [Microbacterium]UWF78505.1 DUF2017 family protein [Microbacterium neungamense]WCM56682.1 DUF2017 family protein [Microbacterium sp. EF45047]